MVSHSVQSIFSRSDGDGGPETTQCTLDVLNTTGRGLPLGMHALEGEGHWEGLAEIWVAVSRVYPNGPFGRTRQRLCDLELNLTNGRQSLRGLLKSVVVGWLSQPIRLLP
jgi:hypothetical protein